MPEDPQIRVSKIVETYQPVAAHIVQTTKLTDSEILLELRLGNGQPLGHVAGQFVQISVFGVGEAPISICSSSTQTDSFELCVRAAGNVTNALHHLEAGDWVGIRGPYGHGFPVEGMVGKDILIVAGGIGLPPLLSLINYILAEREHYGRLIIIYGARSPQDLLFRDELDSWAAHDDVELHLIVEQPDDAWQGAVGVVTVPLRDIDIEPAQTVVAAAVGPPVMYRFVAFELLGKNIAADNIYFSLERRMKCGVGKCGHCQLNNLYVCVDGPVLCYLDLQGLDEAVEAWAPPTAEAGGERREPGKGHG